MSTMFKICTLKFGSWAFDGSELDVAVDESETGAKGDIYRNNTEWDLVKVTAVRIEVSEEQGRLESMEFFICQSSQIKRPSPEITKIWMDRMESYENNTTLNALQLYFAVVVFCNRTYTAAVFTHTQVSYFRFI